LDGSFPTTRWSLNALSFSEKGRELKSLLYKLGAIQVSKRRDVPEGVSETPDGIQFPEPQSREYTITFKWDDPEWVLWARKKLDQLSCVESVSFVERFMLH